MYWVIEDTPFDANSIKQLTFSFAKYNIDYNYINYFPFIFNREWRKIKHKNIFAYGSINLIQAIYKQKIKQVNIFCNFEQFKYTYYSKYLSKYLLNQDYKMISLLDLIQNKKIHYEQNHSIFIKSDDGYKSISGMVIAEGNFDYWLATLDPNLNNNIKLIISAAKEIEKEYRFFVTKNKVLAGSQYQTNRDLDIRSYVDPKAEELALEICSLNDYQPDPVYCLDIGKVKDNYYLIEVNSFSCAGLYACDTDEIVKFIKDYFEPE